MEVRLMWNTPLWVCSSAIRKWITIQENLKRRNKYHGWKNDGS